MIYKIIGTPDQHDGCHWEKFRPFCVLREHYSRNGLGVFVVETSSLAKLRTTAKALGMEVLPVGTLHKSEVAYLREFFREARGALQENVIRENLCRYFPDTYPGLARRICEVWGYKECFGFGELFPVHLTEVFNGKVYSTTYLAHHIPTCRHCDTRTDLPFYRIGTEENSMCETCFSAWKREQVYAFACESCGDWHNGLESITLDGGETVWCRGCFLESGRTCPTCGPVSRRHCECVEATRPIHDYNYKPRAKFLKLKHEEPQGYYGWEIEMERPKSDLIKDTPWHYYKHDGSLEAGAELVTHPFSMEWWQGTGRNEMASVLKAHHMGGARAYNTDTCGVHLHMSKTLLKDTGHVARILEFMYQNAALVLTVSRRKSEFLQTWASCRLGEGPKNVGRKLSAAKVAKGGMRGELRKYQAVNVIPENTFEFRIFRGTLQIEALDMYFQFANAVLNFCATAGWGELRTDPFKAYVRSNRKELRALDDFLVRKGYLPALRLEKPLVGVWSADYPHTGKKLLELGEV